MTRRGTAMRFLACGMIALALFASSALGQEAGLEVVQEVEHEVASFPRALETYAEADGLWATLRNRVSEEPINFVATLIFLLAISKSTRSTTPSRVTTCARLIWTATAISICSTRAAVQRMWFGTRTD